MGGLKIDDRLRRAQFFDFDERQYLLGGLRITINECNVNGNFKKAARDGGNSLNVLYVIEREYRFDVRECAIVIADEAYLTLGGIDYSPDDIADFELVEIIQTRERREESGRLLAQCLPVALS